MRVFLSAFDGIWRRLVGSGVRCFARKTHKNSLTGFAGLLRPGSQAIKIEDTDLSNTAERWRETDACSSGALTQTWPQLSASALARCTLVMVGTRQTVIAVLET
eukprot:4360286-Amphidinium_carterae.1